MKTIITTIAIVAIATISCASSYRATVTEVIDGDTIKAKISGKEQIIELANIDAPELNQPYGEKATDYVRGKIDGQEVAIKTTGKNAARETLAEVILLKGGKNLNYLLVKEGLAWPAKNNKSKPIANLAKQAQSSKTGLWHQQQPVQPWKVAKPKESAIAKYASALSASTRKAEAEAEAEAQSVGGVTTKQTSTKPQYITADDYDINISARQSGDEVEFSGRIKNGPLCDKLKISAYARNDWGGSASASDVVSFSPGVNSQTFDGKDSYRYYDKSKAKPKWEVTSVYATCL